MLGHWRIYKHQQKNYNQLMNVVSSENVNTIKVFGIKDLSPS